MSYVLSRAFQLLLGAREHAYQSGIFPTRRLDHPVVSVGNLTLGGTGKTPLVIALAERFRKEGFRPVVLSRGYGRRSKGLLIVSRGDGPIVKWEESGDEPFLIARRAGVAVVVGADRFQAGQLAQREKLGDLFILDDGFQHRKLFRNVDIVTVDPREWAAGEKLLPQGRWREPKSAIARAHAACVQEWGDAPFPKLPIPAFRIQTVFDAIYKGGEPVDVKTLLGQPVVAFAGIAKPERFFDALEGMGLVLDRRIPFRDHHRFTAQDLESIGSGIAITTEKDSIKLESSGRDVLHLRISATIPEFDQLMKLIRSRFA